MQDILMLCQWIVQCVSHELYSFVSTIIEQFTVKGTCKSIPVVAKTLVVVLFVSHTHQFDTVVI